LALLRLANERRLGVKAFSAHVAGASATLEGSLAGGRQVRSRPSDILPALYGIERRVAAVVQRWPPDVISGGLPDARMQQLVERIRKSLDALCAPRDGVAGLPWHEAHRRGAPSRVLEPPEWGGGGADR
jgi:hypothetical protein